MTVLRMIFPPAQGVKLSSKLSSEFASFGSQSKQLDDLTDSPAIAQYKPFNTRPGQSKPTCSSFKFTLK